MWSRLEINQEPPLTSLSTLATTIPPIETNEISSNATFQDQLDAIAAEMEKRNNNLGYGMGVALGKVIGTINENEALSSNRIDKSTRALLTRN